MKFFSKIDVQKQFGKSQMVTCIHTPDICKNFHSLSLENISYNEWCSIEKNIRSWLSPFVNLDDFSYLYPTSGILGGLDYSMSKMDRRNKIFLSAGEFSYIRKVYPNIEDILQINFKKNADITKIYYFSNPSAILGKFVKKFDYLCDEVWMDLAYVGTTFLAKKLFLHSKTTKIFFSLNKTFGISSFRTGFLFCKYEDPLLKFLLEKHYVNNFGIRISNHLINRFNPLWLAKRYKNVYANLIKKYDLKTTDTVLLATSFSDKFSYWKKDYSDEIRIPMGYAINKRILDEK